MSFSIDIFDDIISSLESNVLDIEERKNFYMSLFESLEIEAKVLDVFLGVDNAFDSAYSEHFEIEDMYREKEIDDEYWEEEWPIK